MTGLSGTLLLLAVSLIAALLLQPLAERVRLPFSAALVLMGFIGATGVIAMGVDTGLRAHSFHDLIFYVFLPLLVFEAAYKIDGARLRANLFVVLIFAIPIMLLSTVIAAVLIYYGIGHPTGFPWIAALLTGALLSATDPVAVVELFRKLGVPERLTVLMDGESLFNDATAIVTFSIFLYIALHPSEDIAVADAMLRFAVVFFGGALIGLLIGIGFLLLSRVFDDEIRQGVVTIIAAYTSYLVAESQLHVSGVMAVLVTGMIMARVIHNDFRDERGAFVDRFWSFNAYLANSLVFLLMGVTVTLNMFADRWLAMIIGVAAVLIARAVGVYGAAPVLNRLPGTEPIPRSHQHLMYLGGLRGAVTLALALSIPYELDYWWTIQSIAFGVVLFTLFVQAPMIEPVIRRQERDRAA